MMNSIRQLLFSKKVELISENAELHEQIVRLEKENTRLKQDIKTIVRNNDGSAYPKMLEWGEVFRQQEQIEKELWEGN